MLHVSHFIGTTGRLLGVDYGKKRIGIAVSDYTQTIATPLEVICVKNNDQVIKAILTFIKEFNIVGIIFGWPLNMNGTESEMCEDIQKFLEIFVEKSQLPIAEWDERMSSRASEAVLIEANLSRKKRKTVTDKVAATYILQGVLDYLNSERRISHG